VCRHRSLAKWRCPFLASFLAFFAGGACLALDLGDISGIVAIPGDSAGPERFLVVNDKKDRDRPGDRGPRVGILTVQDGQRHSYVPVDLPASAWGAKPANDLEGACLVPGTSDTFLLLESGYFRGDYGRIFMVRVSMDSKPAIRGEVLRVYQLPTTGTPFNLEGIACFRWRGSLHLLLGDRASPSAGGDGTRTSHGTLYHAPLPSEPAEIRWTKIADLVAPSFAGMNGGGFRHCSDIYLREIPGLPGTYVLLVAASYDPGSSTGPFRSEVYSAGRLGLNASTKEELYKPWPKARPMWRLDGVKVEALASCGPNGSGICIGTDDEGLGGIWRRLLPVKSMPEPIR